MKRPKDKKDVEDDKRDQVLERMLNTPPDPKKDAKDKPKDKGKS